MGKITKELQSRRQWQEGNGFARQEELGFADCSPRGFARPAALLNLCAAIAGYDYNAKGLPYETLRDTWHGVMLLSRIALRIYTCPFARDLLTVRTWEDGIQGAHFRRAFTIRRQEEGKPLVAARSEWIFVDPVSRKIHRPQDFTARVFECCPEEIACPECEKITLPREGVTELGTHTVVWSELDGNGHLYSGNYADIIWDFLPPELQDAIPEELQINYSREATLGQTLRMQGSREGRVVRMDARGPGGICFTARCTFPAEVSA